MVERKDFLLEIGTEELPPTSLQNLTSAIKSNIAQELNRANLEYETIQSFNSPRRIAVLVTKLANTQPEQKIERRGPSLEAAFDKNGNPTKATIGFANSCKTTVDALTQTKTEKGCWLFYRNKIPGSPTLDLLPDIVKNSLKKLPIPKLMHWNEGENAFVRPVHWLAIIYGQEKIALNIFGITSSNVTYGHRFHHPKEINITAPNKYEELLRKQGKVIVDFKQRRETIRKQIKNIAQQYGKAVIIETLLDEVTGLVEWPVALLGKFNSRFLELPKEVLISTLQKHQKCFAVCDDKETLLPYFITISNIESKNPTQVIKGNEKVINARLTDAAFFFQTDLAKPLEKNLKKLKAMVFQIKLGTLYDKTIRITKIASMLAEQLKADAKETKRAATLAKTDLASEMVYEFPELQGIMSTYYAKAQKEATAVYTAQKEQYMPRFANDQIPSTKIGAILAIADRIDTLVGIFGINKAPTGTKDPFALRRAALGLVRIIIEKELEIDLENLIDLSLSTYETKLENSGTKTQLLKFILERLKNYYLDKGIAPQIFIAVSEKNPTNPLDFDKRVEAVCEFQKLPESESLATANKRVSNILKKTGYSCSGQLNKKLLQEAAEFELAKKLEEKTAAVEPLYNAKNYTAALTTLASLKNPIDNFFDQVMVMTENIELCKNRLTLLNKLRNLFLFVADISLLK